MSSAAKSIFIFGVYLLILGVILVVIPNSLLSLFGVPSTEAWIRVIGIQFLVLASYYIQAARKNVVDFFLWTVYARPFPILIIIVFVLMGFVTPALILFGAVDLLGAIWTGLALKYSKKNP